MLPILLIILAVYGICNIVIWGSIFEGFRNYMVKIDPKGLGKLFTCMICLPTWVGFLVSLGAHLTELPQFSPFASQGLDIPLLTIFLDGVLLSGTTWLINTVQEYFENNQ